MALGGATLVTLFLTWFQRLAFRSLSIGFITQNTSRMFFRLLRLPMLFHMQRSPGEIQFRLSLNNQLAEMISGQVGSAIAGLFMLVCYGALLLTYDVPLALTGLAIAAINLIVLTAVARFRKVLNQSLIQEKGKLMAVAMSGIQLIDTIKASAGEFDFFQRWAGQQAHYTNSEQRMSVSTIYVSTLPVLLSSLNNAVILLYGAWRVIHGHMTAGMLVAFQFLMAAFLLPVTRITELGSQIQEAKGALDKLDDVDNYELDPMFDREFDKTEPASTLDVRGELELRSVTFGYSPVAPPVVTDFSLRLRPGSHVAVVGRSGSGKSTVAKLAAGLYGPWSGEVLYDGMPIADWPRRKLERFVAIVDQQIVLFHDSLRNNLSMWNPMMDEENLIRACRDAQIHEDIADRVGGYSADMDEGGGNFSGGQRQRIEIARALSNDPAVLILDEATSALDPETERRIVHRLRQRGCSCLIVAHRLSTIRDCDEIIVLDNGRVVQRGRHEALILDETGVYARMIRAEI
jgi:ABC-type bacteriocin/lantibiotic exporter with double-glycine peptidase domain